MQSLPLADPGLPDLRSASRFLVRIAWLQRWTVLGGMVFGILWMTSQALVPHVLVALAVVQGWASVTRHRFAVTDWMLAAFRSTQWVSDQTVRLGASLPHRTRPARWSASSRPTPSRSPGPSTSAPAPAAPSCRSCWWPACCCRPRRCSGPSSWRASRRSAWCSDRPCGRCTAGADTVSGLRVLRGVGGEAAFVARDRTALGGSYAALWRSWQTA